jgi:hypothetical protein
MPEFEEAGFGEAFTSELPECAAASVTVGTYLQYRSH